MKKRLIYFILSGLILSGLQSTAFSAGKDEVEQMVHMPIPPKEVTEKKGKFFASTYYDYGSVNQDHKKGQWKLLVETLGYNINNYITPYTEFYYWDRLHKKDYAVNAGTYFRFKDSPAFGRIEIGFGSDIDYIYTFQTTAEYAHRLKGNLYWQAGYKFLNYSENDVYILYPGLIYYLGDHSIALSYNLSITESRGTASWGTIKGDFRINDRIRFYTGTAIGNRLYDIDLLNSNKQYGYILFGGFDFNIMKNVNLKLGGSYSRENPAFIKRSAECALIVRF